MNTKSERKFPIGRKQQKKTLSQKLEEAEKKRVKSRAMSLKEAVTVSPVEQMNTAYSLIGFVLRVLVVFVGVVGLNLFLFDALHMVPLGDTRIKGITVALSSVVIYSAVTVLCMMLLSLTKVTRVLSTFVVLGGAVGLAFTSNFYYQAVKRTLDLICENLGDIGYTTYMQFISGYEYTYPEEELVSAVCLALVVISGVILCLIMAKRVRAVPLAVVCAIYLVPVFTFNITRTNIGLALVLVFICGSIAMYISDCLYGGVFEKRRNKKTAKKAKKAAKKQAKSDKKKAAAELKHNALLAYNSAIERGETKSSAKKARAAVYAKAEKSAKEASVLAENKKKSAREKAEAEKKNAKLDEKAKRSGYLDEKIKINAKIASLRKSKSQDDKNTVAELKKELVELKKNEWIRRHKNSIDSLKLYFVSGFAGGMAMLVAFLAVWLPLAAVSKNFPIIDVINNRMQVARTYVTAYLMGDDIDLNSLSMYGGVSELNPRSVDFNTPQYTGQKLFTVDVGYQAPVYMRSWLGSNYSLETDTWTSADSDEVIAYRSRFGSSYSPDNITYFFNKYVYPTALETTRVNQYRNFDDFGFRVFQVHVKRVSGNSRIIFVPSIMNPENGIMEYGSLEPNSLKYSAYYDGIYSSRFFNEDVGYSVFSSNPVMKEPSLAENLEGSIEYYMLAKTYADAIDSITAEISQMKTFDEAATYVFETNLGEITIIGQDMSILSEMFEADVAELGYKYKSQSFVDMYLEMTSGQRKQFQNAYNSELNYRDYTEETYRNTLENDKIAALAQQILDDNGIVMGEKPTVDKSYLETKTEKQIERMTALEKYGNYYKSWFTYAGSGETVPRHTVIMAVIDYLRENYTYSLDPNCPQKELLDEDGNVVLDENGEPIMVDDITADSNLEAFLFDIKEGYCVHFATSAVALLRELGFAVRYDEGYIASGFSKTYSRDAAANYRTSVRDYDAHAWIEIYYPAMGWMTYECTPSYCEIMYDIVDNTQYVSGIDTNKVTVKKDTATDNTSDVVFATEEEIDYAVLFISIGVIVLVLVVLSIVWAVLKKRAMKAVRRRNELVENSLDERKYQAGETDLHSSARSITDAILDILDALGMAYAKGELPSEYAARVESEYGDISTHKLTDVMNIVEKEEFGGKISFRELCTLAQYLKDIEHSIYASLPAKEKMRMRYILNVI